MPAAFAVKSRLTPAIHKHYLEPLARPEDRKGCWTFPKQIIGSSQWLQSLWDARSVLASKRALIAWGAKDVAFRKRELARWVEVLPKAKVVEYQDCGHFVAEEKPAEFVREIAELDA